jgi:hypothetical protein
LTACIFFFGDCLCMFNKPTVALLVISPWDMMFD